MVAMVDEKIMTGTLHGLDRWAQDLAVSVARRTGWRASSLYIAARYWRDVWHVDEAVVTRALEAFVDLKLSGESFEDTARRVGRIAETMREEEQHGRA